MPGGGSGTNVSAGSTSRTWGAWKRRHRAVLTIAACFLLEFLSALIVGLQPEISVIWVANGLLLAYLLLAPRWRWPRYFAAGFAGQLAGAVLAHTQIWQVNAALATLNVTEVALAALLLRSRARTFPQFTDRRFLLRFVGWAVLVAPAVVAVLYAQIAHAWMGRSVLHDTAEWFTTDSLGMAVATPAFVAIFRTRFREAVPSRAALVYPIALAMLAPVLFHQDKIPSMAILLPLLIMIQLRLGLGWAAAGTLFLAATGSFFPDRLSADNTTVGHLGPVHAGLRLQLMVASAMFMLYAISVVVDNLRLTERKLRETVFLHNLVTENSRDVIIIADFQGNRSYVSAAASSLGGWSREELLNLHSLDLMHPEDRPRAASLVNELFRGGHEAMLECRVRKADGGYVWVEASLRVIRDAHSGHPSGILNIVREISERKRAELARQFQQSLLGAIHEHSLDGILVVDDAGKAVSFNQRFAEVWQIRAPDVPRSLLKPVVDISDQHLLSKCLDRTKDPAAFLARVEELYADRKAVDHCQVELKDGRTLERYTTALHTDDGRYLGRVWFFRDVTDRILAEQELKAAYDEVEKLAVIDALTGIANRRRFDDCLQAEWRRALRECRPLSMIVADVDLFKLYNDTHGHLRGDECLKEIADCAVQVVTRPGDLVARFGGEEFAVILPHTDEAGALAIAQHFSRRVHERLIPHHASPHRVVTISAGCATMIPHAAGDPSCLIEKADRAMYEAKRRGRNHVCVSADELAPTPLAPGIAP